MQEGNFVTPVDNEERHIYISQIKEASISNWGDILRAGSNGSLSSHKKEHVFSSSSFRLRTQKPVKFSLTIECYSNSNKF